MPSLKPSQSFVIESPKPSVTASPTEAPTPAVTASTEAPTPEPSRLPVESLFETKYSKASTGNGLSVVFVNTVLTCSRTTSPPKLIAISISALR